MKGPPLSSPPSIPAFSSNDRRLSAFHVKLIVCLFLIVSTAAVYWQVQGHDFIIFDDPSYITENPHVNTGLTLENLRWAFTSFHAHNWHPLTWVSHMLDCQLFGLNAGAHHLMNVFIHILNSVLLFLILNRMTKALWRSAFVAALFALHPLHVESVAWASERKDVLSTLFWLLTMGAYASYVERPETKRYLLTLGLYALGLMAKPMLVTLPFVLLLLDYWPLKRFTLPTETGKKPAAPSMGVSKKQKGKSRKVRHDQAPQTEKPAGEHPFLPTLRKLLWEKAPFFLLSAISCIITVQAQQQIVKTLEYYPFPTRVANALVSYAGYLLKAFYPAGLAVFYPYTGYKLAFWQVGGAALLLVLVTVFVIWVWRRPYLIMGWLWYLGTLVPVIGLVQVGLQAMADRYTYVPLTGIFVMVAWGIPELLQRVAHREKVMAAAGVAVVAVLSTLTYIQTAHWKDDTTLFRHAVEVTTDNYWAHYNLGLTLAKRGELDRALDHFKETVRVKPDEPDAYNNIGIILAKKGQLKEAVDNFSEALRKDPANEVARKNLAVALSQMAKKGEKLPAFEHPPSGPGDAESYYRLAVENAQKGNLKEALSCFSEVLRIRPDHFRAHNDMGVILARTGRLDEAITHFREALRAKPDFEEARYNLKVATAQKASSR